MIILQVALNVLYLSSIAIPVFYFKTL